MRLPVDRAPRERRQPDNLHRAQWRRPRSVYPCNWKISRRVAKTFRGGKMDERHGNTRLQKDNHVDRVYRANVTGSLFLGSGIPMHFTLAPEISARF